MKIVKWVTGLDSSLPRPKLLYPDMWDRLREKHPEDCNRLFEEAEQVVIECIRKNAFKFGGSYHQCGKFGMPFFDDGTVFFVTMRHWGSIMYKAWHPDGDDRWGYCRYAWAHDMHESGGKVPASEKDFI